MKNRAILLLITLLLVTALFGCGQPQGEPGLTFIPPAGSDTPAPQEIPPQGDMPTIRFMLWDSLWDATFQDYVLEAVNQALPEAGVRAQIAFVKIPQRQGVPAIATGEVDAIVLDDYTFSLFLESNLLADLSEELAYFPDLQGAATDTAWKRATQPGGGIFAIPQMETSVLDGYYETSFSVREDVLSQLGASVPTSPEELLELSRSARDAGLPYQIAVHMTATPHALHRSYEQWPFFVDENSLLLFDTQGRVSSYIDSDIFQRDMQWLRAANAEGLTRVHTTLGTAGGEEGMAAFYPLAERGEGFVVSQFNPQGANFRIYPEIKGYTGVWAGADVPLTLSALEAIYTRQEVFNALFFGREGLEWRTAPDGRFEMLYETDFPSTYQYFSYPINGLSQGWYADLTGGLPQADPGTTIDFSAPFFAMPAGSVQALTDGHSFFGGANGILAVRSGLASEVYLEPALDFMREKGLEQFVAEAQVQYDEFLGR